MEQIIKIIEQLKNSKIKQIIDSRIKEFEELGKKSSNEIFKEICFCLMTANFSAHGGIKIQNAINNEFLTLNKEELAKKLSELGHRFPNTRAKYIIEAQKYKDNIKEILNNFKDEQKTGNFLTNSSSGKSQIKDEQKTGNFLTNSSSGKSQIKDEQETREWIVKNIKGLGMKEASHFLRNIGYKNLAIIDFHIMDLLVKNNLIEAQKSRSLTPKKYLEIENLLRKISEKTKLSLGELDLYLWYEETGKVLK